MSVNSLGEVIATRRLSLVDEPNREILVKMGKPQETAKRHWCCPIQVTGIGNEKVYAIYGVDAFQAVGLALSFIRSPLDLLNKDAGGRLRWIGDEKGGFGFP